MIHLGPGYAAGYGIPEMGYGANSYAGPYAAHQVCGNQLPPNIFQLQEVIIF